MPLTPVAHSVLYLFEAAAMNESHPLTCPPWTSNVWRELFGLFPLKGSEDYYDAEIDVVGDSDPQLDSSKELGLTMPESSIASITENRRKALGLHADYVRKIPIRKTIKSTTRGEKGGPDPYGYAAYRNLVLAAINRKGGVMNQVEETLGKIGATPADLWKDDRSLNRERPATKRVLEHQVPIADTHARLEERDVQAALARALFGDAGVSSRGTVVPELIPTIRCFAQRKYENLARSLKRHSKLKAQIPKALRDATRALTDWRKIAIGTKEVDELHFLSRERTLKQLWSSLGFGSLEDDLTSQLKMVREEEMQAAYAYYVEEYCYGVGCLDESELPIPTVGVSGLHSLVDGCEDIGVSHLKSLSTEALWAQLGLPGVDQFRLQSLALVKAPKTWLHWPKLVRAVLASSGRHSQNLGRRFHTESGDCAQPTLLCDNVGLGKTVQIIGVISMIQHYYKQRNCQPKSVLQHPCLSKSKARHTLQAKRPYQICHQLSLLRGHLAINGWSNGRSLPSLVVLFLSGPYRVQLDETWSMQGEWLSLQTYRLLQRKQNGAYSSLLHSRVKMQGSTKLRRDTCFQGRDQQCRLTLWNALSGGSCGRDTQSLKQQSHSTRGSAHYQSSSLVIGATATPLFTSLKCLLALGRNLRYQPLLGEQGVQVWNEMQEMLSTGNESWRLTSTAVIQATVERELQAALLLGKIPLYTPALLRSRKNWKASTS
ncbi:SNF2 family amino-terminal protein [Rhizoctonia solani]|uniref:SNF2 family amino-terminal protein n=1 Tax=Rhizoctonia solani TaxID=456999 RepID=A0A8H8P3E8_9AGAM|nr:SNF2 family amino-terminal protein [Rhizoctonia solani]QRW23730.1 SNF2 family amino-terminal protein [Rhizoctonia solani]